MLNHTNLEKIRKITLFLSKLEVQTLSERQKIDKNLDSAGFARVILLFYKNFEYSSIVSNEIYEILDVLELGSLANLLQKVVKTLQNQLSVLLSYQIQYYKSAKNVDMVGSGSFSNLLLDVEQTDKQFMKVIFNNQKKRRKNNENKELQNIKEENMTLEEQNQAKIIENERLLADLNNILANKEANLQMLTNLEARNISAKSELMEVRNDINKNKNAKVIYTGEDIDSLLAQDKNKNNNYSDDNDEILKIPYFAKKQSSILRKSVKILENIEEKGETISHKSRIKLSQHELRSSPEKLYKNKGTEPDPEIFDINELYVAETLLNKKNELIDDLESQIHILTSENNNKTSKIRDKDYEISELKGKLENLLTKMAELKLMKATLNLEENALRKTIIDLQKEIGRLEILIERKDEEMSIYLNKTKRFQEIISDDCEKIDELEKDLDQKKLDMGVLKINNTKMDEFIKELKENNNDLREEVKEIKQKMNEIKERNQLKESMSKEKNKEEKYILIIEEFKEQTKNYENNINELNHKINLLEIEKDKLTVQIPNRKNTDFVEKENKMTQTDENKKHKNTKNFSLEEKNQIFNEINKTPIEKILKNIKINDFSSIYEPSSPFNLQSKTSKTNFSSINKQEDSKSNKKPSITLDINDLQGLLTPKNNPIEKKNTFHGNLMGKIQEEFGLNKINRRKSFLKEKESPFSSRKEILSDRNADIINNKNKGFFAKKEQNSSIIENKTKFIPKIENYTKNNTQNTTSYEKSHTKSIDNTYFYEERRKSVEKSAEHISSQKSQNSNSKINKNFEINEKNFQNNFNFPNKTSKSPQLDLINSKSDIESIKNSSNNFFTPKNTILTDNTPNIPTDYSKIYKVFRKTLTKQQKIIDKDLLSLENLTENQFIVFLKEFTDSHINKCGVNCPHLKRFYKKIGLNEANLILKRQEIKTNKTIIANLPKI